MINNTGWAMPTTQTAWPTTFTQENVSQTQTYEQSQTTTNTTNSLDGDMFFKLLAAQLQNQDPMENMDSQEMILQMAQFASIEQLNNMNAQLSLTLQMSSMQSATNMVGKEVAIGFGDEIITGKVTEVGFSSAGPVVKVGDKFYDMWSVISVSEEPITPPDTSNSTADTTPTA